MEIIRPPCRSSDRTSDGPHSQGATVTTLSTKRDSRRGFLKQLFAAGATGVGGGLAAPARAGAGEPDVVKPFRVGAVRIADHVIGPLVFQTEDYDYLLFDAHQTDRRGRSVGTGVAVVRLTQCAAWRMRTDGDQDIYGRAADPSALDAGGTYEVNNSSWVLDVVEEQPALVGGAALHHCVFTFKESHFECVLAGYDFTLYEGEFDDLVDHLSKKD